VSIKAGHAAFEDAIKADKSVEEATAAAAEAAREAGAGAGMDAEIAGKAAGSHLLTQDVVMEDAAAQAATHTASQGGSLEHQANAAGYTMARGGGTPQQAGAAAAHAVREAGGDVRMAQHMAKLAAAAAVDARGGTSVEVAIAEAELTLGDEAATRLQAGLKGLAERREARDSVVGEESVAASVIQGALAGFQERQYAKEELTEVEDFATSVIQASIAGLQARKRATQRMVVEDQRHEEEQAARIQAGFKGFDARQEYNVGETEEEAAMLLQAGLIGRQSRQETSKVQRERQEAAAQAIKAALSGYEIRRLRRLSLERASPSQLQHLHALQAHVDEHKKSLEVKKNFFGSRIVRASSVKHHQELVKQKEDTLHGSMKDIVGEEDYEKAINSPEGRQRASSILSTGSL
jgi:hypothetical protein